MTDIKHTPGPWLVSKPSGNYIEAPAVRGSIVALTFSATPADAHLVAAAPDLLEALEALARKHRNFEQVSAADVLAAEAAIAKAKGEI